ncbi:hypothetical protein Barb6_02894 [Bacteroidales bacterium Barb6]|nr:hypothetical protein Barb6_02894 [Bacteroidales bacterium Barb6]
MGVDDKDAPVQCLCTAEEGGGFHVVAEEALHGLVTVCRHRFGMPLYAENVPLRMFRSLVDAVRRYSGGDKTGCRLFDGLMMKRIDKQVVLFQYAPQLGRISF